MTRGKSIRFTAFLLTVCLLIPLFPAQVSAIAEAQTAAELLGGPIADTLVFDQEALKKRFNETKIYEAVFSQFGAGFDFPGEAECRREVHGADIDRAYSDTLKSHKLTDDKLREAMALIKTYEARYDDGTLELLNDLISSVCAVSDILSEALLAGRKAEIASAILSGAGSAYGAGTAAAGKDPIDTGLNLLSLAAGIASTVSEGAVGAAGAAGSFVLGGVSIVYTSIKKQHEDSKKWDALKDYANARRMLSASEPDGRTAMLTCTGTTGSMIVITTAE